MTRPSKETAQRCKERYRSRPPAESRICAKCGEHKKAEFFSIARVNASGLSTRCKVCQKQDRAENGDLRRAQEKAYRDRNRDKVKSKNRAWIEANVEKARSYRSKSDKRPEAVAMKRARMVDYRERNRDEINARIRAARLIDPMPSRTRTRERHRARVNGTPMWADRKKIRDYYVTADALGMWTGEWYHVDHIVPLRGKTVCGLHVENNLQILPASVNIAKGNTYWPEKP